MIAKREIVVGIDLGTTNSCVAYNGKVVDIENAPTMPSMVAFLKNHQTNSRDKHPAVGVPAANQAIMNPQHTLYETKRLIGHDEDSLNAVDPGLLAQLSYTVTPKSSGSGPGHLSIEVPDVGSFKPEEIATMIVSKLIHEAESTLGNVIITGVVITVPAYFQEQQREATKKAVEVITVTGEERKPADKRRRIQVLRVINEPTAAAIAYGMSEDTKKQPCTVAVYDMGGGTFDISIVKIEDGVFDVVSTGGDAHLGGADFDREITTLLEQEFMKSTGIDIAKSDDMTPKQRIRRAAENAKKALSGVVTTLINEPFITADASGPKHLEYNLTLSKFKSMTQHLLDRAEIACKKALADAQLTPDDIDEVLMVGGMTCSPIVQERVKQFFSKEPCRRINPDQAVAIGASIQADSISGKKGNMVVLDITPLSLGIETLGGVFTPLVTRNTKIPTKKSQIFSTAQDNQTAVGIKVYQGEREMAADNKLLSQFDLTGVSPAPRGRPQIEVTFDIDANGILHVSAQDKATGKQEEIQVSSTADTPQEEIDRMVAQAEEYKEADKKRKRLAEEKNASHAILLEAEELLAKHKDNLNQTDGIAIHEAVEQLKTALDKDDEAVIGQAKSALLQLMPKLHEAAKAQKQSDNDKNDDQNETADDSQAN